MASTKSTLVTNADAGDTIPGADSKIKRQAQTVETAVADAAGHEYRMLRVHSSWKPISLKYGHDAVTNMSTADIGAYLADGGAVVDVDLFADAVNMTSASAGMVECLFERANTQIDKVGKAFWEWLGLSSDPNVWYDLAITATTNDPSVAVTLALDLQYTDNSR